VVVSWYLADHNPVGGCFPNVFGIPD